MLSFAPLPLQAATGTHSTSIESTPTTSTSPTNVFMAEQHASTNKLSRRPSANNPINFRWRRTSTSKTTIPTNTSSTPQDPKPEPPSSSPSAPASKQGPPPALARAPDSREEIKRLLRVRDSDTDTDGTTTISDADSTCSRPMQALEDKTRRRQIRAASISDLSGAGAVVKSSTLVPDSLPVQPGRDIPNAAPFRAKYNIYNPSGPKYYTNIHLVPPNTRAPLSSVFSPSFPPQRTAIGSIQLSSSTSPQPQDASTSGTRPVLSREPSHSPIPTPSNSQTRLNNGLSIGDAFPPPRSRKVSATAHDNVDMLDASDPYGKNWHHDSPYEVIGLDGPPPLAVRVFSLSIAQMLQGVDTEILVGHV